MHARCCLKVTAALDVHQTVNARELAIPHNIHTHAQQKAQTEWKNGRLFDRVTYFSLEHIKNIMYYEYLC